MSDVVDEKRRRSVAVLLALMGAAGLSAAFALTVDKFTLLADPNANLSCTFSALIGCATNLNSPQGAIFGFPNPILGLVGWSVSITVGVVLMTGVVLPRWFWRAFNVGLLLGLCLVVYLIHESIYVLGVLCPWCMVTWVVMIATFVMVTSWNLTTGVIPLPDSWLSFMTRAFKWWPVLCLATYVAVAVLAQLRLDWVYSEILIFL